MCSSWNRFRLSKIGMRLLTHNLMMCNRKQCSGGYPLRICPKEKGDVGMKDSLDESSPEPEEPQVGEGEYLWTSV